MKEENKKMHNIPTEKVLSAIENGFEPFEAMRGWIIVEDNSFIYKGKVFKSEVSIPHIEKIDIMDVFVSDELAAKDAMERCGVAIIQDIEGLPHIYFEKYRKYIEKPIKKYEMREKKKRENYLKKIDIFIEKP